MSVVLAHVRADVLQLVRYPAFSIPTLFFPALFFLFFAAPRIEPAEADSFLAAYMGFAVLGVAFFQFGVGIATERTSPWEAYLRTLAVSVRARFAARILSALQFALASSIVVAGVAVATTSATLPAARWVLLFASLLVGSIPFALLGIALGYWTTPRGALPLANILYLVMSFTGGLWTAGTNLPEPVAAISPYVPTRQLAEVLWGAVAGDVRLSAWMILISYGVVFAALAWWGYRRDEGERFS